MLGGKHSNSVDSTVFENGLALLGARAPADTVMIWLDQHYTSSKVTIPYSMKIESNFNIRHVILFTNNIKHTIFSLM